MYELSEAWLINGNLPLLEHGDLGGHLVDAHDVVAAFGETRARN
jgi:hypothetical protein